MNLDESRRRGGIEGNRLMAERIHQQAVAKQEEWALQAAREIEHYFAACGRGHPEILAQLERRRSGGYQAA